MSAKDRLSTPLSGYGRNRDVPSSKYAAAPKTIKINDVMVIDVDGEPANVRVLGIEKVGGSTRLVYNLLNLSTMKKFMVKTATHFTARATSGPGVDYPSADDKSGTLQQQYLKRVQQFERTRRAAETMKKKKGTLNLPPSSAKPGGKIADADHIRVTERHPQPEFHVHVHDKRLAADDPELTRRLATLVTDIAALTEKADALGASIHSLSADIQALGDRMNALETDLKTWGERVTKLEDPHPQH